MAVGAFRGSAHLTSENVLAKSGCRGLIASKRNALPWLSYCLVAKSLAGLIGTKK